MHILPLLLLPALAHAHGIVSSLIIDGKTFTGNLPRAKANPSVIRQVADVSPVKGAMNKDINCGLNAQSASLTANANPGSVIEFDWTGGDMSNWPHNTGPMLTYMASCGSTTCDKFDPQTAKWFKIQQVGRKDDGSGDWAQQDLMNGAKARITLPANLAPGNYIIRHEIIALHLAPSRGGAEFYPSCAQLVVGGSGTGTPSPNELVSLPGAYSDDDPGIFDPSVFNTQAPYTFPGPSIAAFVSQGPSSGSSDSPSGPSSSNSTSPTSSANSPSKTQTPSSSSSSAGTKGSCKLKKPTSDGSTNSRRSTGFDAAREGLVVLRPRHLSRIMRNLRVGGGSWHH